MNHWQLFFAAAAAVLLLTMLICSARRKKREYRQRDFTRSLETLLQPRETIKVICSQKKGRVILTSKRVLMETKSGFHAVPIKSIKKVQGSNEKGNRTISVSKMASLTIKADNDYIIKNECEEFAELAKELIRKTAGKK